MKRTVVLGGSEARNELPVQAKRGHAIADALLRSGRRSMDRPAHFLEGGAVLGRQAGEICVDSARVRRHDPGYGSRLEMRAGSTAAAIAIVAYAAPAAEIHWSRLYG